MVRRSVFFAAALCAVEALAGSSRLEAAGKPLHIYFIDVEGGAATLIVTPAGESFLVDPGYPGERDPGRIAQVAKEVAGLEKIDIFLSTHWHTDHLAGLERLVELIPVKRFYDRGMPEKLTQDIVASEFGPYRKITQGRSVAVKPGDEIPLRQAEGSLPLRVKVVAASGLVLGEKAGAPQVRPCDKGHKAAAEDDSDNAKSVAFLLTFGDFKFFDGADLTLNVEHKLVCPENLVGGVDVFQVDHHGFAISNHPALLAALRPRVAIMNNGPTKGGDAEVFARLKQVPEIEAVFQMHRNLRTKDSDNAPAEFILSTADEKSCKGGYFRLAVDGSGKSYGVEVSSKGTKRTYKTRA